MRRCHILPKLKQKLKHSEQASDTLIRKDSKSLAGLTFHLYCQMQKMCLVHRFEQLWGIPVSRFWSRPWRTQQSSKNMLWSHWWGEVPGSWPACVHTWSSLISHFLLNVSFNFQGHKDGCLGSFTGGFGSNLGNNTFGWLGHLPVDRTVMSFHVTCFITSVQDHSGSASKRNMGGLHQKTQTTAKTQNEHSESAALDSGGSAWCNRRFRNPGCAWWSKALHQ